MKVGIGDALGSVPVDVASRSPFIAVVPQVGPQCSTARHPAQALTGSVRAAIFVYRHRLHRVGHEHR
jgi:hypothetical protein